MTALAAALPIASAAFALALVLAALRLLRGPSLADRVLALDALYVNAIGLLVLHGLAQDSRLWIECALVIALLGFGSTLAAAKYLLRGDISA